MKRKEWENKEKGVAQDIGNKKRGTNQSEIKDFQESQADFPSKSKTTRDKKRPTYSWYLNVVNIILVCVF